jgi:hypothetical protein
MTISILYYVSAKYTSQRDNLSGQTDRQTLSRARALLMKHTTTHDDLTDALHGEHVARHVARDSDGLLIRVVGHNPWKAWIAVI